MPANHCPTKDELSAYLFGELPDESIDKVAQHIDHCAPCEVTVAALEQQSNTVLVGLRRKMPSQYANDAAYQHALSVVEKIGRDASQTTSAGPIHSAPSPPIGRLREYELLEKLGEGGMGAVYTARHTKLDKVVAIKVLPMERMKDRQAVIRFEREMRAVGRLDHPNIVRAMDAGEVDGMHFLVMEYVKGLDLSQLSKQRGPLAVADACELIRQAAVGLEEARENGMVHRDIKPSNLMLCVVGKKKPPVVKVLDMGLALLSEAYSPDAKGLTSTGQMMGTIDYMAPEQGGDSHDVDIRADIYSLGASLYKLLCGEVIYHGPQYQTPVQKLMALATQPAPPIQQRRAGIPDALAAVLHRMLEKYADRRFATPEEVVQALAPFCAGANLAALLNQAGFDVAPSQDASATEPSYSQPESETGVGVPSNRSAAAQAKPPVAATERTNPALAKAPPPKAITSRVRVDRPPVATPAKSPAPAPRVASGAATKRVPWLPLAVGGGLLGLAGVVVLATILFFQTSHGTLRVEINDPSIEVLVKGSDVVLKQAEQEEITLTPGAHALVVKRGDFQFETDKLILTKGDTTIVRVDLLAGEIKVVSDGTTIGKKSLGGVSQVEGATTTPSSEPSSPALAFERGNPPLALKFDGVDDYVMLPEFDYKPGDPITFEAMVTPAIGSRDVKGAHPTLWGNDGWFLILTQWGWQHATANMGPIFDSLVADRRDHVAAQWDGDKTRLFVNGVEAPSEGRGVIGGAPLPHVLGCMLGAEPRRFFPGTIDEVRISRGARYSENFSAPTHSHFASDKQTLALYHFDEGQGDVLKDSSGNQHHGKIVGAKWMKPEGSVPRDPAVASNGQPAAANFALEFDGKTSLVNIPSLSWDGTPRFTVEAWIASPPDPGNVNIITVNGDSRYQLFRLGSWWAGTMSKTGGSGGDQLIFPSDKMFHDRMAHVAYVVDGKICRLFENGKLISKAEFSTAEYKAKVGTGATIGGLSKGWFMFRGRVDEIRISNVPRYADKFTPAHRFEPDADTVALYHCDEGQGEVLSDSSGNKHHGKIVGVTWVPLDQTDSVAEQPEVHSTALPSNIPSQEYALLFDGKKSHVDMTTYVYDGKTPITVEAYAIPLHFREGDQCLFSNHAYDRGIRLCLTGATGHWRYCMTNPITPTSIETAILQRRVHVAGVYDRQKMWLFVDGKQQGDPVRSTYTPVHTYSYVGGDPDHYKKVSEAFKGVIEQVRISKNVRYDGDFQPAAKLESDANTVVLYRFDEGSGNRARDLSGNGYDGVIKDAQWIKLKDYLGLAEVDLLAPLDPETMSSTNIKWERVGASLVSNGQASERKSGWVGFTLPTEITGDYEVEIEFLHRGYFPIQIDFPLEDTAVRIDIGGDGGGLMLIDGKERGKLAPPLNNSATRLKPNVPQTLIARVRQAGSTADIEVTLDGLSLGKFSGERKRITLPHWVKPDLKHVKSGSLCDMSKCHFELRRAVYRPLPPLASDDDQSSTDLRKEPPQ